MPLAKPAVSTVIIYDILHTWNEFIYAMTLVDSKDRMTLPVGLKNFYGEAAVNIPAIMCAVFTAPCGHNRLFFLPRSRYPTV